MYSKIIYIYQNHKVDTLAVIGAVIGSILVALNIGLGHVGYMFYLLNSVATLYLLHKSTGPKSLVAINWYFTTVNVIGILRFAIT